MSIEPSRGLSSRISCLGAQPGGRAAQEAPARRASSNSGGGGGSTHQVKQHGAGHVAAAGGLVEVHIDALQLQVALAGVLQQRERGGGGREGASGPAQGATRPPLAASRRLVTHSPPDPPAAPRGRLRALTVPVGSTPCSSQTTCRGGGVVGASARCEQLAGGHGGRWDGRPAACQVPGRGKQGPAVPPEPGGCAVRRAGRSPAAATRLPELGANLVAALAGLRVREGARGGQLGGRQSGGQWPAPRALQRRAGANCASLTWIWQISRILPVCGGAGRAGRGGGRAAALNLIAGLGPGQRRCGAGPGHTETSLGTVVHGRRSGASCSGGWPRPSPFHRATCMGPQNRQGGWGARLCIQTGKGRCRHQCRAPAGRRAESGGGPPAAARRPAHPPLRSSVASQQRRHLSLLQVYDNFVRVWLTRLPAV